MERIYAVDQEGTRYTIPESSRAEAIAKGWRIVTTAEDQPIRAGVEALARGATLGASDYFFSKFGGGQEAVLARKEENPTVAPFGEIAGAIAPALATGGGSLGGRVAAGGIKAAAKAGLKEGAIQAIQPLLTEDALQNKGFAAERIAAHVVGGALAGGAFGAAGAAGAKLMTKGAAAVNNPAMLAALEEKVATGGRDAVLKGLLASKSDLRKLNINKNFGEYVKWGDANGLFNVTNLEGVAAKAEQLQGKGRDAVDALLSDVDRVISPRQLVGPRIKGRPPSFKLINMFLDHPEVAKMEQNASTKGAVDSAVRQLRQQMKLKMDSWQEFRKIASTWTPEPKAGYAGVPEGEVLRKAMNDVLKDIGEEAVPGTKAAWEAANENMHKGIIFGNMAKDRLLEQEERLRSSGVMAAVGSLTFGMDSAVKYFTTATAADLVRDRGGLLVTRAMKGIKDHKVFQGMGQVLEGTVKVALATAPQLLGPFRIALEKAAAEGADALMETHMKLATGPEGTEYLNTLGMAAPGATGQGLGEKFDVLAKLQDKADGDEAAAGKGIAGVLSGAKTKGEKAAKRDYHAEVKAVRDAMADPQKVWDTIPEQVQRFAPALAAQSMERAQAAIAFLDSKAPRNPNSWKPAALQDMEHVSRADQAKWLRYADAVRDPAAVFESMKRGVPPVEHVEAVKAIYPETFAVMTRELFANLEKVGKKLPYSKRNMLYNTFGFDATNMSAWQAKALQASHASAKQAGTEAPPNPNGRQTVDTNKNYATQGQRMESR